MTSTYIFYIDVYDIYHSSQVPWGKNCDRVEQKSIAYIIASSHTRRGATRDLLPEPKYDGRLAATFSICVNKKIKISCSIHF